MTRMGNKDMEAQSFIRELLRPTKQFNWLILAFFLLDSWWLMASLFILMAGRPLPQGGMILCHILAAFLFLIPFVLYFKKEFPSEHKIQSYVPAGICGLIIILLSNTAVAYFMRIFTSIIPSISQHGTSFECFLAILYFLMAFVSLGIIFLAACVAASYLIFDIKIENTGIFFIKTIAICIKKPGKLLKICFFLFITLAILLFLRSPAENLIAGVFITGFSKRFMLSVLVAVVKALLALLLINATVLLMADKKDELLNFSESKTKLKLIFPFSMLLVFLVLLFVFIPRYTNSVSNMINEIENRIYFADISRQNSLNMKAAAEYSSAYADLKALQAYLNGIIEIKEKSSSQIADELIYISDDPMTASPYRSYFAALLAKDCPADALDSNKYSYFDTAVERHNAVPEASAWLLGFLQERGEKDRMYDILNQLISRATFTDGFERTKNFSTEEIKKHLSEIAGLEKTLESRLAYVFMQKAEYDEKKNILYEMAEFSKNVSSPDFYYYMAILAEKCQDESRMYEAAKRLYECSDFANEEEEKNAALFVSYMFVGSQHYQEAIDFMKGYYEKYPHDAEIFEDYAYTFLAAQEFSKCLEIIDENIEECTDFGHYIRSVAYMKSKVFQKEGNEYQKALEEISLLANKIDDKDIKDEKLREIDDYIYQFLLVYLDIDNKSDKDYFLKLAENLPADSIIYNYVMGLEACDKAEYDKSNMHFGKVLAVNDKLAHPYHMIGVNYNEMWLDQGRDCSAEAEKYFLKFLDMRDENLKGYFCLAYHYKNVEEYEKAARAFSKVLDIGPYEYGGYGFGDHSRASLEELRELSGSGE